MIPDKGELLSANLEEGEQEEGNIAWAGIIIVTILVAVSILFEMVAAFESMIHIFLIKYIDYWKAAWRYWWNEYAVRKYDL